METRKSLGVEEKSSKFAMSSCLTWMGSQSSMTNLENNQLQIRVAKKLHQDAAVLSASSPDFGATRIQHVQVHVLHENRRCALRGETQKWASKSPKTTMWRHVRTADIQTQLVHVIELVFGETQEKGWTILKLLKFNNVRYVCDTCACVFRTLASLLAESILAPHSTEA